MSGDAPMARPSVPEADRLIGVKRPVLTHGFVVLVDYMGNDAAIVQAARVSYGAGTKSVRDDRGLIRYLMRHRHTTPFEMVEFKFLVRLPIYVARQWIRHRTACLAEGTKVIFDLPKGPRRGSACAYPMRVEEIWRKFQPTKTSSETHQGNPYFRREQLRAMLLRQVDEESRAIRRTRLVDVTQNGVKPVFRMTLDDGKWIDCTADHRFLFAEGWNTLVQETGLHEAHGRAVWDHGVYQLSVNGTEIELPALYHDREWLEHEYVRQKRSIPDLAGACGVDPQTIRARLLRVGLPLRHGEPFQFTLGNTYSTLRPSRRGIPLPRASRGTGEEPYASKKWMERKWVIEGLTARQIAEECGSSHHTIRKWLRVHGLTNHPAHPTAVPFPAGGTPWNKGKTYRIGPRGMPPARLAVIRAARAGPASNFWKGGVSSDWQGIGRWTTQIAATIHERNYWTCQLCLRRTNNLHAHHIIPVWADLSKARDPSNLTTLCSECHREVHKNERAYVELLGGPPIEGAWFRKPRVAWNKLTVARLSTIEKFEFIGLRMTYDLEVEGPFHNFVANGIVTHNSVNEYSARYSIMPDEFDVPPAEEVRRQSGRNRQGRGESLSQEVVERFRGDLERVSHDAYEAYTRALDAGVARETARLLLPVSYYTQWYWKINLYNLFHFLSLRLDPHAQEEIRLYAAELAKIAQTVCPVAFEAFEEFQLEGMNFGRRERQALRSLLEGATPEKACADAGLPLTREDGKPMVSGEGVEFLEKLERIRARG